MGARVGRSDASTVLAKAPKSTLPEVSARPKQASGQTFDGAHPPPCRPPKWREMRTESSPGRVELRGSDDPKSAHVKPAPARRSRQSPCSNVMKGKAGDQPQVMSNAELVFMEDEATADTERQNAPGDAVRSITSMCE